MSTSLRRNKALHSLVDGESHPTFIVAKKSLPKDKYDSGMHLSDISLPKYVDGPETENLKKADETCPIFKTIASLPIENVDVVYSHLLQLNKSYQAMAPNNKVIVFTDDITVRKAFYALIYNSTRTGLVLDSKTFKIYGVLSATDFIMILMKLWKFRRAISSLTGNKLSEEERVRTDISNMPIHKWKEHLQLDGKLKPFQTIGIEDSLFAAASRLSSGRIHRLPVIDEETGDCMFIITHRRLLHFIWKHAALLPKPTFLRRIVKDLEIGTWKDIKYVVLDTPLIDVLDLLINGGISGVPVLKDEDSLEVVNVYTRFDAISVAFSDGLSDLSVKVRDVIQQRKKINGGGDGVVTVPESTDVWSLLELFVRRNVHRIIAVDRSKRLKVVALACIVGSLDPNFINFG